MDSILGISAIEGEGLKLCSIENVAQSLTRKGIDSLRNVGSWSEMLRVTFSVLARG